MYRLTQKEFQVSSWMGTVLLLQGHHQRPWTITMREFANNVHQVSLWWLL